MADRKVNKTGKDSDGDITALCSDESWSRVSKGDAINHINNKTHTYYVRQPGTSRADIRVVNGHLRSDSDNSPDNNLDNLPDC